MKNNEAKKKLDIDDRMTIQGCLHKILLKRTYVCANLRLSKRGSMFMLVIFKLRRR